MTTKPKKLFISYSHEDEPLRNELVKHLRLLKRQGKIVIWDDREIAPGAEWEAEIVNHLDGADIILLLISPDFLDSDYCYNIETKRAMEHHEKGKAKVIPVNLRPVDSFGEQIDKLQVLPDYHKSITEWDNRDRAFTEVAAGIRKIVTALENEIELTVDVVTGDQLETAHQRDHLTTIPEDEAKPHIYLQIIAKFYLPDAAHPNLSDMFEHHWESVKSCSYCSSNSLIVSTSSDGMVKVWDVNTGKVKKTFEGHSYPVNGCAFNYDGSCIVSASSDRSLKIWDLSSKEAPRILVGHKGYVNGCAFSPDGNLIVSASSDRTLIIWDACEGKKRQTLERLTLWGTLTDKDGNPLLDENNNPREGETDVIVDGHSEAVNDCAFSSNGKLIVSASDDHTLKIWDAESGTLQKTLEGHSDSVNSCAFTYDDKLIISASSDRSLRVWDVLTGRMLCLFEGHLEAVNDFAFSPDRRLIVSASDDCKLKVWEIPSDCLLKVCEVSSGQCLATFHADDGMNCCVIDGETLIAGGERGVYSLKLVWQIEEEKDCSSTTIVESDEVMEPFLPTSATENQSTLEPVRTRWI